MLVPNSQMGAVFAKLDWLWQSFQRDTCILVLGLDNAGKTATLYSLQLGEPMPYTVPTLGFNVEQVSIGKLDIKMWDLGGQTMYRKLWPHYFCDTDGIVFVVDASDRDRFGIAKDELHTLMSHKQLSDKPFLVLANKQDLPNAAQKKELRETLELDKVDWLPWHIVECCATKNQRARVGFEWLANQF